MDAIRLLDVAYDRMRDGETFDAMEDLLPSLKELRQSSPAADWQRFARHTSRAHPIAARIHQAPFTRRAFEKPRGYPGDAETLDYIYGQIPLGDASDFVREFYRWEYQTPSCGSVRARRDILARLIDECAAEVPDARVLSIACGHLREGQVASALRAGRLAELVALGQDATSLARVADEQAPWGVRPVLGSVRQLLTGQIELRDFDLVYAAGLFDYLARPIATRLVEVMFRALRAGGRLVVPNFTPDLRDVGYLETYMDWNLTLSRRGRAHRPGAHARPRPDRRVPHLPRRVREHRLPGGAARLTVLPDPVTPRAA